MDMLSEVIEEARPDVVTGPETVVVLTFVPSSVVVTVCALDKLAVRVSSPSVVLMCHVHDVSVPGAGSRICGSSETNVAL
jgi:hypothetical protein